MWVTIYTDASWQPDKQIAAYSFWIKSEKGRLVGSRLCSNQIKGINQAEIYAIVEATKIAVDKWDEHIEGLCINTDSQHALYRFTESEIKADNIEKRLLQSFDWLLAAYREVPIKTSFRHIKGHYNQNDTRSWLNKWCHKQAKQKTKCLTTNQF